MMAEMTHRRSADSPRAGRAVLWLAAVGLLFSSLMPLTRVVVQHAQAAAGVEQIVICSALGFRTIAFKDGGQVDTDPSKSEKMGSTNCPICFTATAGYAILPVGIELTVSGTSTTVLYGAASQSTPARADFRPSQARAPPAIV